MRLRTKIEKLTSFLSSNRKDLLNACQKLEAAATWVNRFYPESCTATDLWLRILPRIGQPRQISVAMAMSAAKYELLDQRHRAAQNRELSNGLSNHPSSGVRQPKDIVLVGVRKILEMLTDAAALGFLEMAAEAGCVWIDPMHEVEPPPKRTSQWRKAECRRQLAGVEVEVREWLLP